jgi:hypothetical protein
MARVYFAGRFNAHDSAKLHRLLQEHGAQKVGRLTKEGTDLVVHAGGDAASVQRAAEWRLPLVLLDGLGAALAERTAATSLGEVATTTTETTRVETTTTTTTTTTVVTTSAARGGDDGAPVPPPQRVSAQSLAVSAYFAQCLRLLATARVGANRLRRPMGFVACCEPQLNFAPWVARKARATQEATKSSFLFNFLEALRDLACVMAHKARCEYEKETRYVELVWRREFFPRFKKYVAALHALAPAAADGTAASSLSAHRGALRGYWWFMQWRDNQWRDEDRAWHACWERVADLLLKLASMDVCSALAGMRPFADASGQGGAPAMAPAHVGVLYAFGEPDTVRLLKGSEKARKEAPAGIGPSGVRLGKPLAEAHRHGLLHSGAPREHEGSLVPVIVDVIDWLEDLRPPHNLLRSGVEYRAVTALAFLTDPTTGKGPLDHFATRASDSRRLWPIREPAAPDKASFDAYVRNGDDEGDVLPCRRLMREHALHTSLLNVFTLAKDAHLNDGRRVRCIVAADPARFAELHAAVKDHASHRPLEVERYMRARALNQEWSAPLRKFHALKGPAAADVLEVALLRDDAREDARASAIRWVDEGERESISELRRQWADDLALGGGYFFASAKKKVDAAREHWNGLRETMGLPTEDDE